jgi:hypothetical protein
MYPLTRIRIVLAATMPIGARVPCYYVEMST